jgi:hypothetical protein
MKSTSTAIFYRTLFVARKNAAMSTNNVERPTWYKFSTFFHSFSSSSYSIASTYVGRHLSLPLSLFPRLSRVLSTKSYSSHVSELISSSLSYDVNTGPDAVESSCRDSFRGILKISPSSPSNSLRSQVKPLESLNRHNIFIDLQP